MQLRVHAHCHLSPWNVNVDTEVQIGQKFNDFPPNEQTARLHTLTLSCRYIDSQQKRPAIPLTVASAVSSEHICVPKYKFTLL